MANSIFSKGLDEYEHGNFQKAVELYTEALMLDDKRDDIYSHRAQAFLQLQKYTEVIKDCEAALQFNKNNSLAYLCKGSAFFALDDYKYALNVFQEGQKKCESDVNFELWIKKCQEHFSPAVDKTEVNGEPMEPAQTQVLPIKPKHEWYQTHTHVCVTVLVKNVKNENLSVELDKRKLRISIKEPLAYLDITLAHEIDSEQTSTKILPSKVEIKLKKKKGLHWSKLEGEADQEETVCPLAAALGDERVPAYPSSSLSHRNWDLIAKEVAEEEKDEKLEGDAALNQFFQKLYADASDETKRAMMKSFSESGGTVLSTNWQEVGSKKVDVKPPDGMEFKKWES